MTVARALRASLAGVALALLGAAAEAAPEVLQWADLVPAGGAPQSLPSGVVQHGQMPLPNMPLQDRSPWGDAFAEALSDPRSLQPPGNGIRTELDGKEVRIAGYITPLGFDGTAISEFLLVPYVGACIHVPPPPSNQIVFVSNVKDFETDDPFAAVWVTGTLRAVPLATDLADVGYQIENPRVELYSE